MAKKPLFKNGKPVFKNGLPVMVEVGAAADCVCCGDCIECLVDQGITEIDAYFDGITGGDCVNCDSYNDVHVIVPERTQPGECCRRWWSTPPKYCGNALASGFLDIWISYRTVTSDPAIVVIRTTYDQSGIGAPPDQVIVWELTGEDARVAIDAFCNGDPVDIPWKGDYENDYTLSCSEFTPGTVPDPVQCTGEGTVVTLQIV